VSFGKELRKKGLAVATSQEKNLTFWKIFIDRCGQGTGSQITLTGKLQSLPCWPLNAT